MMNINKLLHGPNVAGQSLVDRVMAAKHSLTGEGLAKSVCKATTEEPMPPKKKHIDYLVQCTHEPNVSVPQMAGLLVERAQNDIWIVVFKSLISTHTLMNYGNERFMQYLASNNCSFSCDGFMDKTSPQGYDMSPFVRRYAKYLNAKAFSYRQMAYDFCKIKKGKDDGVLRIMEIDKLLKVLPILQAQVDTLLEFDVTRAELNNSVINASFMMLFKDLIRLLACYNDGIINLLAKYFEMTRKQCKEALDIYRKFVSSMENVAKFLAVAESVGIDKGDIPDLAKAPSSLLEALEAHMKSLEGTKKGTKSDAAVTNAIHALTATTAHNGAGDDQSSFFDEGSAVVVSSNNPFADVLQSDVDDTSAAVDGFDLFGSSASGSQPVDDLNDEFGSISTANKSSEAVGGGFNPFFVAAGGNDDDSNGVGAAFVMTQDDPWSCQGSQGGSGTIPRSGQSRLRIPSLRGGNASGFASDDAFAAAFGQEAATTPGKELTFNEDSDLATTTSNLNITSPPQNQTSSEDTNNEWNAASVSVPAVPSSTGEESNTIHVTSNYDDSTHQQEDGDVDLFADLR